MKKILFSLTALILLTSCSDDDTESITNQGPQLVKMKSISYYNNVIEGYSIYDYSNEHPFRLTSYNGRNEVISYHIYSYNSDGLLVSIKNYNSDNTQAGISDYIYDANGRISSSNNNSSDYTGSTIYTYNNDNTITGITTTNTHTATKTYYTNNDNLIYKEIDNNNNFFEIVFDGFNPVSSRGTYSSPVSYEYMDSPTPPANYYQENVFGSYKPNAALFDTSVEDHELDYATKYEKKEIRSGSVTEFEYVFNDAQLPINVKEYRNGTLEGEREYTYE